MSRTISGAGRCALVALALGAAAPVSSQTVTRDSGEAPARVSKVDAIAIKQTAASAYLKIGDIKGESSDKGHKGEIEILSWSWGSNAAQPSRGPGTLTITKRVDKSSPGLAEAVARRRKLGQVTLTLPARRQGEQTSIVTLEEVVASALQATGSDGRSTETISFNYTKVKF
jgi:type VI secretion system secreted protein Hcp